MKKTFLTFIAVGFGFSVAFAQTTPIQENEQEEQVQTEQSVASQPDQAEQERRQIALSELPQEAQDAFNNGQYSDMQVLAIYEKSSDPAKDAAMSREQTTVYEFELAQAEEATETGTTDDGLAGVETEKVSERQPDIILHIDEKGQVVKEQNLDEEE